MRGHLESVKITTAKRIFSEAGGIEICRRNRVDLTADIKFINTPAKPIKKHKKVANRCPSPGKSLFYEDSISLAPFFTPRIDGKDFRNFLEPFFAKIKRRKYKLLRMH